MQASETSDAFDEFDAFDIEAYCRAPTPASRFFEQTGIVIQRDTVPCCDAATCTDALGYHWCEEHAFRGQFLDWGARNRWPALHCGTYAVCAGVRYYTLMALFGHELALYYLLEFIEQIESERKEQEEASWNVSA